MKSSNKLFTIADIIAGTAETAGTVKHQVTSPGRSRNGAASLGLGAFLTSPPLDVSASSL